MKNKLVEKIIEKAGNAGVSVNKLADDFGISWATMDGIMHGRTNLKPPTKEKLARALGCSIGDINELIRLSDQKGAIVKKETAVMDAVDKVSTILAAEQVAAEQDTYGFTDPVAEVYSESREDFKNELRDLFISIASNIQRCDTPVGDLTASFGKAVLDMLAEEANNGEAKNG